MSEIPTCRPTGLCVLEAGRREKLEVLKWLYLHCRTPVQIDELCYECALVEGHVQVVRWFLEDFIISNNSGIIFQRSNLEKAIKYGHVQIVSYFYDSARFQPDISLCLFAHRHYQGSVLNFFLESNQMLRKRFWKRAIQKSDLRLLEWMRGQHYYEDLSASCGLPPTCANLRLF